MSDYYYLLERICKIMDNIEKDLHSIDVSLGAMKPKTINEIRQKCGFEPVPDINAMAEYVVGGDVCESEISKRQRQMVDQVISNMHVYVNKENIDE